MELAHVWAGITTAGTVVFGWLYARRAKIYDLLIEVLEAAKDDRITEEEFQRIVDRAIEVLGVEL